MCDGPYLTICVCYGGFSNLMSCFIFIVRALVRRVDVLSTAGHMVAVMGGDAHNINGVNYEEASTDLVVDNLMLSLDVLHEDYERTLRANQEGWQSSSQALQVENVSSDEEDSALAGYAMLGSEDEQSPLNSETEDIKEETELPPIHINDGDSNLFPDAVDTEARHSENFADFDNLGPLAMALTDEQVSLIQGTMRQVNLIAPPWADNLSDAVLDRMLSDAVSFQ